MLTKGLFSCPVLHPKAAVDSLLCCALLLCPRHSLAKEQSCSDNLPKQTKVQSQRCIMSCFSFAKGGMLFVHAFQGTLLFMSNLKEKYLILQGSW